MNWEVRRDPHAHWPRLETEQREGGLGSHDLRSHEQKGRNEHSVKHVIRLYYIVEKAQMH
jgi:hypothetical protein